MGTSSAAWLPAGMVTTEAAVLLLDRGERTVVQVNPAAAELTGPLQLPISVDAWCKSAALTDLDRRPLRDDSPLHRALLGQNIAGVPVLLAGREDTPLWTTAFPAEWMSSAAGAAVVVLQHLTAEDGRRQRQLALARDRAVCAMGVSFVLTDPHQPDNPLIWVNQSFTELTGYQLRDVVGRNCRFLQGDGTDASTVERVRRALAEQQPVTEVMRNYRADGGAFWNEVSISPVFDEAGRLTHYAGLLRDVTDRVRLESQREAAWVSAEESRSHLRLLTEATTSLNETLDVADAARKLADVVVPAFADFCCVDLRSEPGASTAHRLAVSHRRAEKAELLRELGEGIVATAGGGDLLSRTLSGGPPLLLSDLSAQSQDAEDVGLDDQLRPYSTMLVPLRARGRVLGVLTLSTERPFGRQYTQRDLEIAVDLAARAALAIDNVRLYAKERDAAVTLQRSLLPRRLPELPGLELAARYRVAAGRAAVGGDWYDVLSLPDGAVGLAVGDVVGHDLRAAAAMGQLRGLLRCYAWEGLAPALVLDRCDQLVQGMDLGVMATVVYARLEGSGEHGMRRLRIANAGHPHPLLRDPRGEPRWLTAPRSPLVGAVDVARQDIEVLCEPGSLLLFYSDGIVELRDHDPDERLELLWTIVRDAPSDITVDQLCDEILAAMATPALHDDLALLAIRVDE